MLTLTLFFFWSLPSCSTSNHSHFDIYVFAFSQGMMTMEEMKTHLSADTPKSAELMLKHGVISEREFEELGIPLKALTPAFRAVREARNKDKQSQAVSICIQPFYFQIPRAKPRRNLHRL